MDCVIKTYHSESFGKDLVYCRGKGIMYQKDMSNLVSYDEAYFKNYVHRESTEIAVKLNKARCGLAEKHCRCVVDVGVGSGEFIRSLRARGYAKAYGFDINPTGVKWLEQEAIFTNIYESVPGDVEGFTLWDTLEHIPNPQEFFAVVKSGQFLLVSLPIFSEIEKVRDSKHYKPGEHLYYFQKEGLIQFLSDSGFDFIEYNDDETQAGREGIGSFVFRKR